MSKVNVKTKGVRELAADLKRLDDDLFIELLKASQENVEALEQEIKKNYSSHIKGEYKTGVLENSIGSNIAYNTADHWIGSSAGVFKIDSVMTAAGKDAKSDIPAPQTAYWLEYGVQPHSVSKGSRAARKGTKKSRARKAKIKGQISHTGIAATGFITKAYEKYQNQIDKTYADYVNKSIDKATK